MIDAPLRRRLWWWFTGWLRSLLDTRQPDHLRPREAAYWARATFERDVLEAPGCQVMFIFFMLVGVALCVVLGYWAALAIAAGR